MDQLFTEDSIRMGSILNVLCEHLDFDDLLQLEGVSHVTCAAVRSHHYDRMQFYFLRYEPGDQFCGSKEGTQEGLDGRRGPIVTRAHFNLSFNRSDHVFIRWDALLINLAQLAAHLVKIKITIFVYQPLAGHVYHELWAQTAARLVRITFSRCTTLEIRYKTSCETLLPGFLAHFPALERLTYVGGDLQTLCDLPAPEKLRRLEISLLTDNQMKSRTLHCTDQIPNLMFSRLSHLTLLFVPSERGVFDFLALTPALEHLKVSTYLLYGPYPKIPSTGKYPLKNQLRSLRRLTIHDLGCRLSKGWIGSLRRLSSGNELQVMLNGRKLMLDEELLLNGFYD